VNCVCLLAFCLSGVVVFILKHDVQRIPFKMSAERHVSISTMLAVIVGYRRKL
jgi:hypothetical protein